MALELGTNAGFVTVAPTTDPQGSATTTMSTRNNCTKHTTPAGAIKIIELGWWCQNATQEANFEMGIYDDDADSPGTLLTGTSRTNAKGTGVGWKTAIVDITVSESTDYWIAVQLDSTATTTNLDRRPIAGPRSGFWTGQTTMATTWAGGENNNDIRAIYALVEGETPAGFTRKIKISGTFQDKPIKTKVSGTFEDKPIKIKVGGTFQDA